MSTHSGVVKHYNDQKGYGFIVPDDGGPDVFMHVTNLVSTADIMKGDRVTYELEPPRRQPGKMSATKVRLAS